MRSCRSANKLNFVARKVRVLMSLSYLNKFKCCLNAEYAKFNCTRNIVDLQYLWYWKMDYHCKKNSWKRVLHNMKKRNFMELIFSQKTRRPVVPYWAKVHTLEATLKVQYSHLLSLNFWVHFLLKVSLLDCLETLRRQCTEAALLGFVVARVIPVRTLCVVFPRDQDVSDSGLPTLSAKKQATLFYTCILQLEKYHQLLYLQGLKV